jgi:hypothetical protein
MCSRQPRIRPISLCGQFTLEFEKLGFVGPSCVEVANVVGGDLIERLGEHQTIGWQAQRSLILAAAAIEPPTKM